jgi:hypothetical protein
MRTRNVFVVPIAATLVCSLGIATGADALVSGPPAGGKLPGGFRPLPLNVTNAELPSYAGTRNDYVEQFGASPVVLVFGRGITDPLTNLVKELDAEVGKHKAARLRAVLVMLSGDDEMERALREFGERQGIEKVSLAIAPDGPKHYKLSQEAEVTVVVYNRHKVEANHAFRKGELNDKAIGTILADVSKVVSRRR